MSRFRVLGFLLLVATPCVAAPVDLCAAASATWDVKLAIAISRQLSETPFEADAELNEWRSPGPGHYRLYVVSHRVYRSPDPGERRSGDALMFRSNRMSSNSTCRLLCRHGSLNGFKRRFKVFLRLQLAKRIMQYACRGF